MVSALEFFRDQNILQACSEVFYSYLHKAVQFLLISTTSVRPTDSVSSPVWPWSLISSSLLRSHLEKQTLHIIKWKKRNNPAYLTNMLWLAYSLRTQNSIFFSMQFTSMAQFFCKDHFAYQVLVFCTKISNILEAGELKFFLCWYFSTLKLDIQENKTLKPGYCPKIYCIIE